MPVAGRPLPASEAAPPNCGRQLSIFSQVELLAFFFVSLSDADCCYSGCFFMGFSLLVVFFLWLTGVFLFVFTYLLCGVPQFRALIFYGALRWLRLPHPIAAAVYASGSAVLCSSDAVKTIVNSFSLRKVMRKGKGSQTVSF
ncbi:hypothetical protein KFK09_007134 [Dendrobium nobile]|uniref:Uncharacterized protein n=1 Tax=Dendrobium nobile TaxID=94219 RepID=A0A8T3BTH9_DENNO|nr:hypothetical protein KFK09_007134 [Dendrobium nobile]